MVAGGKCVKSVRIGEFNLRPYLGNIFLLLFTEIFFLIYIATISFTAYARDNSKKLEKASVQNKEILPQGKKSRVIYTLY